MLLNPWVLAYASKIQIFQLPFKLSENVKMFQFQASKQILGRGFQNKDIKCIQHRGLSQVWISFKTNSSLFWVWIKKNSIKFILHLRIGTCWAAIILHICEEDIRNSKMTLLFLSSLGQVWLTYFQNCFKSECNFIS